MFKLSNRLIALTATLLAVFVCAPEPAAAQGMSPLVPAIGTTMKYQGFDDRDTGCQAYVPYDQYVKIAGRVILPETKANVFYFLEAWGRDSETIVLRFTPNGDVVQYYLGAEGTTFVRGPVGTYSEVTDPSSGNTLRYEVVADGLTRTVPAGTYNNVIRLELSCMTCGPSPVLLERHYVSPEVAFPIVTIIWDAQHQCWARWHSLVSVSRK